MKAKYIIITVLITALNFKAYTASFIWTGNSSSSWSESGNWSGGGGGTPGAGDFITINSNAPNNLVLDQNRSVTNFTINGDTIDLGTYTLTTTGVTYFNGGKVQNGTLSISGSLCHFGGGILDVTISANCGYYHMNGGIFKKPTNLISSGSASTSGTGNCVFEDSLSITHSGTVYFTMGSTNGDSYQNLTITNHSTHEVYIGSSDTSFINGNLIVNNTSSGGVVTGYTGGVTYLATGKTISIGGSGFSNNYLTLKNFYQQGSTGQTLTLTGSAILNLINANFEGNLTVTSPGILLKNSTFNGTTSITRNGTSGSFHCDGGNLFSGPLTLDNAGSSGRIRMANTTPDTYMDNVTFNSSGGQDVQIAYYGNNNFSGDLTILSNKVVFNTASGRVTFTGGNSQALNGSYNYSFEKLVINKNANHVTANTTLSVDDSLIFVSGNLITTSTNLLTMKHGSTASGASNSSFVSGPVKKTGNSSFQFPVGKGTHFRLVEITAPSNSTDAFTAEYFDTTQTSGSNMDTTITFISDCGYWSLNRNTGTSNITPKFAFDSTHCDYLTVKPVHIAFWDGTKWVDKGEGVNDSNTKKTSSAVTTYGNYALAYKLMPGDAPQMPYQLTIGTTCTETELLFDQKDIWFAFTPDSAIIKIGLYNTDELKLYAPLERASIFEAYSSHSSLSLINQWNFDCDSLLQSPSSLSHELIPFETYLLKISQYDSTACAGIYDSTNYFLNICILNLRTNPNTFICYYSDAETLLGCLGNGTANHPGSVIYGDIVAPASAGLTIDLTTLNTPGPTAIIIPPLIVDEGIRFTGDYDLLSESVQLSTIPALAGNFNLNTSPGGTIITYDYRGLVIGNGLQPNGYMFIMKPASTIRNLRIKGAMPGYQDFNEDYRLCGGIKLETGSSSIHGPFLISHCELFNFSHAGLRSNANTDSITLDHCYIHHVKGGGGATTSKGYGAWFQGATASSAIAKNVIIKNCIFDEGKEALDTQPNPLNMIVDSCSFGQFYTNETINKHSYDESSTLTGTYNHPAPSGGWTSSGTCLYFDSHNINTCSGEDTDDPYSIYGPGAGNVFIKNSSFLQKGFNISIPYLANIRNSVTNPPLFQLHIINNTFKEQLVPQGSFDCNYGGYARLNDNYIEECSWDYERNRTVNNVAVSPGNPDAMLINSPNAFSYSPGNAVVSGSPQPPEVNFEYTGVAGYVTGLTLNSTTVPYVNMGDDIDITCSHGSLGSQNVTYVVRPHPSNGAASPVNVSSGNHYDDEQIVTAPSSTPVNITFGPNGTNLFDTDKPGLYGIDVMAVDGSTNSRYYSSPWVHKPIIVAPSGNHQLIFNIKDSYYAQLYGKPTQLMGVYKQVELNGNVIWREDISEGDDGWEQVQIDLMGQYVDENNVSHDISSFFVAHNTTQTITFSISIDDPTSVITGGGVPMSGVVLQGLRMWVDDVYLKKFDHPGNLISDGDVEGATGGMSNEPKTDCIWYFKNLATFAPCFTLDDSKNIPDVIAETEANLTFIERKSGSRAIELKLPGIHYSNCTDYDPVTYLDLPGPDDGEVISVAVDFDYRDFFGCYDYPILSGYEPFDTDYAYNCTTSTSITGKNLIIEQDITVTNTTLEFIGCNLVFSDVININPKIIVDAASTLIIRDNTMSSKLFACGEMWQGIRNNGGDVIIRPTTNPTEIYDAWTALETDGGFVDIRFALFDHNYIGLNLKNGSFIHGNLINGQGLIGIDFKCSGGKIMKAPYAGEPSNTHILLENVTQIQIGSSGSTGTGYTNTYSDAVYGIRAINSSAVIINNDFTKMQNYSDVVPCFTCGTAIYALNDDGNLDFTIGGAYVSGTSSTAFLKNEFSDSKMGIFTRGNFNLTIQGNKFEDMVQGVRTNRNSGDIEINEGNTFENVNFGITAYNVKGNVEISNNIFTTLSTPSLPHTTSFNNTAITIQNPLSRFVSQVVSVFGNEIMDYRIGIHAINIPSIGIGFDLATNTISGNIISYTIDNFPLANYHGGIWLQNCAMSRVIENSISNTEFNSDENFRGVDIESSLNCDVNCNEINNLGVGINFFDECGGTELRENEIKNFFRGIWLNGTSGAIIDLEQGVPGTSNSAWDNEWTWNANSLRKVDGLVKGGFQINWYHQGADDANNPLSPNPWNGLMIDPEEYQYSVFGGTCSDVTRLDHSRVVNFGPVVGDSATYIDNVDENSYLAKKNAYWAMKSDSTIIYQGDSLDTDFVAFYESNDTSNIGKFILVSELLTAFPDSASSIIAAITPENDLEEYLKDYYVLFYDKISSGDTIDSSDSTFVESLTGGAVSSIGESYFYALAYLFKEQHPAIVGSRFGNQSTFSNEPPVQTVNSSAILVFPNPSTGKVTVKLQNPDEKIVALHVYNSTGNLVLFEPVNGNSFELHFEGLREGIYFVRTFNDKNQVFSKSFNILR